VAQAAESALKDLDPQTEVPVVRRVFERLVRLGDGPATRRRVSLEALETSAPGRVGRVVDQFVSARLLTVSEGSVELAHEALVDEWQTLREWLERARIEQRVGQGLEQAAGEWATGGRDPALVFRGGRLDGARAWAEGRLGELSVEARQFLLHSLLVDGRDAGALAAQMPAGEVTALGRQLLARPTVPSGGSARGCSGCCPLTRPARSTRCWSSGSWPTRSRPRPTRPPERSGGAGRSSGWPASWNAGTPRPSGRASPGRSATCATGRKVRPPPGWRSASAAGGGQARGGAPAGVGRARPLRPGGGLRLCGAAGRLPPDRHPDAAPALLQRCDAG